jgi:hypothetical protein
LVQGPISIAGCRRFLVSALRFPAATTDAADRIVVSAAKVALSEGGFPRQSQRSGEHLKA